MFRNEIGVHDLHEFVGLNLKGNYNQEEVDVKEPIVWIFRVDP